MLEVLPTATLQPVIATARKLVVIAHLMLKNREPYRYAVPATTRDTTQGQPKGMRVHKTPALDEVYSDEGLPAKPLSELGAGETKILTEMKV